METATRKLIDIKPAVFQSLSVKAKRKGVSLKRYIEDLLESDSLQDRPAVPEGVTDPGIISLIGVAKPVVNSEDVNDDRLQYILSK